MSKKLGGIIVGCGVLIAGGTGLAFGGQNNVSEVSVTTTEVYECVQDTELKDTLPVEVKITTEESYEDNSAIKKQEDNPVDTTKKSKESKSNTTESSSYTTDDSSDKTESTTDTTVKAPEDKPTKLVVDTTEATTEQPIEPEQTRVWVPDRYEKVWVVDEPARVDKIPIYEEVPYMQCNVCKQKMYSVGGLDTHFGLGTGPCGPASWSDGCDYNIVGYDEIKVEEKGHYENQLVEPGHWE